MEFVVTLIAASDGELDAGIVAEAAARLNGLGAETGRADWLAEGRACRLDSDFALHLTEVTLAMQNAGEETGPQDMTTTCPQPEPMPWAR